MQIPGMNEITCTFHFSRLSGLSGFGTLVIDQNLSPFVSPVICWDHTLPMDGETRLLRPGAYTIDVVRFIHSQYVIHL